MHKTKKYIAYDDCHISCDYGMDGGLVAHESDIVEMPDLDAMTDKEKLEWVLHDIGALWYTEIRKSLSGFPDSYVIYGRNGNFDEDKFTFDANGKLRG